ncbi:MAG: hypothetical protein ACR2FY_02330 [Pirellulaceae bacterium]
MNCVLLAVVVMAAFKWLLAYGSVWLAIGVLFTQVFLLSFWGAFRGGSLVIRLGAPFLAVVSGGFLAIELIPVTYRGAAQFAVLPVPLIMAYLVGLGLLLPFRWWSGKTLLFTGEEPPSGRPRQFRIDQVAAWTLLMGVTLGLTPAATAADLADVDLEMVLLGPCMIGFLALLSIPLIRGVFASSRVVAWSVCGLLLVLGIGLLLGGAVCALFWQRYRWRFGWGDYMALLNLILTLHGIVGLTLLGNLAVIRWLGGRFVVQVEPAPPHSTTPAPQPSNSIPQVAASS